MAKSDKPKYEYGFVIGNVGVGDSDNTISKA